jgi:hypothetical protein
MKKHNNPTEFLAWLNTEYARLHRKTEQLFWKVYMGEHDLAEKQTHAQATLDAFRANTLLRETVIAMKKEATKEEKKRLQVWEDYFALHQAPPEAQAIKKEIDAHEAVMQKKLNTRTEGYTDPHTGKFVNMSDGAMRMLMVTSDDEAVRKACFEAREGYARAMVDEYIQAVELRNAYAKARGFEDFYAFKLATEEQLTKKEVFDLFDEVYAKTAHTFQEVRDLEKTQKGLREPWNFSHILSGDFTKEEDQYFQFEDALLRWGRSFSALGISYAGGTLQLDLLDRKGKHNNGFCHYPQVVYWEGDTRIAGSANFTCNVVPQQVGHGAKGHNTLFHEGGHAADRLNSEMKEVVLNDEYAPASISWAETQSMFLDTMFSSMEWRHRYAKNSKGEPYPFELYTRKVKKTSVIAPYSMYGIMYVTDFERHVYEMKHITREKVLALAKRMHKKYFDMRTPSIQVLAIPHLYSMHTSAYYQDYGLATLALLQWREYFYKKYGHIVDNPQVGKEMKEVWKLGSSKSFVEFVKLATGKKLSAAAFIREANKKPIAKIREAKKRIAALTQVPEYTQPVQLDAAIKMVDGKKTIATNKKSFEDMAEKYKKWYLKQEAGR